MPIPESQLVEIIQEAAPSIGAMGVRRLKSIQKRIDIDDIMQITAMKAIRSREKLATEDPVEALHWVQKIGFNCVKTELESNRTQKRCAAKDCDLSVAHSISDPRQSDPTAAIDFDEDLGLVKLALSHIVPSQARAVEMRYLAMAEYDEICSELGVSLDGARALVKRGLAAVRSILNKQAA